MTGFPYQLVYEVQDDTIVVWAFHHSSRRPHSAATRSASTDAISKSKAPPMTPRDLDRKTTRTCVLTYRRWPHLRRSLDVDTATRPRRGDGTALPASSSRAIWRSTSAATSATGSVRSAAAARRSWRSSRSPIRSRRGRLPRRRGLRHRGACGPKPGRLTLHINSANPTVTTASTEFVKAADGAGGWESHGSAPSKCR